MMKKYDRYLLIAALAVWALLIILFAHPAFAAPTVIVDNGDTITIDKASFQKMGDLISEQSVFLNRAHSKIQMLEDRYDAVESCVRESAKNGNAVTPCFNVDPTEAFTPKQHQEFLKNTVEY
jgi:hypothetical protein